MKIKLNTDLAGYKKDAVIKIKIDSYGLPTDKFWRARLKDSEIDNCIEKMQEEKNIEIKPTKSNKKRVK